LADPTHSGEASLHHTLSTPTCSGASIALHAVGKRFGELSVVSPLDLRIPAGQFAALLGPSGCGKSTLLRIIAGLEQPSLGHVELASPSVRPRLAYVFQDAHLLPWRTVLRNVALPLEILHVPAPQRLQRARQALRQVGLEDFLDSYPAQLSGGMRMRVSLARALVVDPELLLLDEPFAALDEITRQQLDEQLRALWKSRRMTVVFVTHSINEGAYLAERAIVLSRRPARVMLDHRLDLPEDRPASLRTDPHFAGEARRLFDALQEGQAS
jgi:NitT/TauT family transport system ATP-binding protein